MSKYHILLMILTIHSSFSTLHLVNYGLQYLGAKCYMPVLIDFAEQVLINLGLFPRWC